MGDRPLTEADMEGLRGELVNLNTQMAGLLTALNNQFAALPQQIANAIQGGGKQRGPNPNQQRGNIRLLWYQLGSSKVETINDPVETIDNKAGAIVWLSTILAQRRTLKQK